jgi:maleate isomerase
MSTARTYRIGQIVPSSNTTMETEVPALLRAREAVFPERFTFHSSRMRMQKVTPEELRRMDQDSDRCAVELSDARMDAMAYACLVAIMSIAPGYHREAARRLEQRAAENGDPVPVITSAGALVEGLHALQARRVAMITPYMRPLTETVCDYLRAEGFEIADARSLEIADNLAVGARDPLALISEAEHLDLRDVDAIVLSACVQMPSLAAIESVERATGLPVTTASVCTTYALLKALDLTAAGPLGGALLRSASRQVAA